MHDQQVTSPLFEKNNETRALQYFSRVALCRGRNTRGIRLGGGLLDNPEINNAVGRRGLFAPARMKSARCEWQPTADGGRRNGRSVAETASRSLFPRRTLPRPRWKIIRGFGVGAEFFPPRLGGRINLRWSHGGGGRLERWFIGEFSYWETRRESFASEEKMWYGRRGCCNLTFC